jgi:hypothetical protein
MQCNQMSIYLERYEVPVLSPQSFSGPMHTRADSPVRHTLCLPPHPKDLVASGLRGLGALGLDLPEPDR